MKKIILSLSLVMSLAAAAQSGHYGKKNFIHINPSINFNFLGQIGNSTLLQDDGMSEIMENSGFINTPLILGYERLLTNSSSLVFNFNTNTRQVFGTTYKVNSRVQNPSLNPYTIRSNAYYVDYRIYREGLAPLTGYLNYGLGLITVRPSEITVNYHNENTGVVTKTESIEEFLEQRGDKNWASRNFLMFNFGGGVQYPLNKFITFGTNFNMAFDTSVFTFIERNNLRGIPNLMARASNSPASRRLFMRVGFDLAFAF